MDFPGDPVVKTLFSNARGVGSIPVQGARIPHALLPKTQRENRKNIVTKSIKTFKRVHIKKSLKKKKKELLISKKYFWKTKQKFIYLIYHLHNKIQSIEQHTINIKITFRLHVHVDCKMHLNVRNI